ncbi:MAG: hypothetical protein M3Z27_07795 [Actinomycetota bacterium]|nr:hypothetical protein [Actinomycetota bacterium]
MRRILGLCALLALLALPGAALAGAPSGQVRVTNCLHARYKPRTLIIACGDGGILLEQLRWSRWTRTRASGSGLEAVNDCSPDCARGHFHRTPATVTLSRPISCRGQRHRLFDLLSIRFRGVRGPHATERDHLGCPIPA